MGASRPLTAAPRICKGISQVRWRGLLGTSSQAGRVKSRTSNQGGRATHRCQTRAPLRVRPRPGLLKVSGPVPTRLESFTALGDYDERIRAAIAAGQHHDQRRAILVELLRDGFGLTVDEMTLEHNVKVAKVRGRIDLLYGTIAWEVKRDLDVERGDLERELQLYLTAQGPDSFGIGTDGLRFEVYRLDDGALRLVDGFDIDEASSLEEALDWLDSYLFAVENVAPTGDTIVTRFGLESAVYRSVEPLLAELWGEVAQTSAADLKRSEWEHLLEVVYGTQVASDSLWFRHTYLVMVARLMAYLATTGALPAQGQELGALTGELFQQLGLENMVERDFFSWPGDPAVAERARRLLRALSNHLGQFALQGIDEDVLKQLYEHIVDPAERHFLGEYYTPDWLADLVLERSGFGPDTRMLDPACGSGTFLFAAIRRLRAAGLTGKALVEAAVANLTGLDIHPVAITTSRANFVLALRADLAQAGRALTIPVFMADTLAQPEAGFGLVVEIAAPVDRLPPPSQGEAPWPARFALPTYREDTQTASLAQIVDFVDELSRLDDETAARRGLETKLDEWGVQQQDPWLANLRLLRALRANQLDTIWSFLLTNAARPHEIAQDPVDMVIGNPPWLTLMDMQASDYRERVRSIAREFGLVQQGDPIANMSHLDTSTVFAVFCAQHFLPPDRGRVAFVLPRSVMAGAKQHARFREGRIRFRYQPAEAIDLRHVEPLFRIPACVMIFDKVA